MRTRCGHGEKIKNAKTLLINVLAFKISTQTRDRNMFMDVQEQTINDTINKNIKLLKIKRL